MKFIRMDQQQRKTLLILSGIFLIYFMLFIPANLTGAKDPVMISIFEPDEFAQYSIPRDMITSQGTVKQNIYNFIAYDHYYYGYPFYLSSIVSTFPLIITNGLTSKNTQLTMLLLRQLVSVLPMCIAVGLLVFAVTRFRKPVLGITLACFILTVPAVVENNLWWHPDSLVIVFIVSTLAALLEDKFQLGKYFWLAAIACGLAAGTKVLGFFFFLTIPLYLGIALYTNKQPLRKSVLAAIGFVLIMFITLIISNPYLLIPSEFNRMLQIMTRQSAAQSAGWTLMYDRGFASWLPIITRLYGSTLFWLVCLMCLLFTIATRPSRIWGLLLLSWTFPLSIYILFFAAIKPTHFLLPVAIPLFGVLIQPFLFSIVAIREEDRNRRDQFIKLFQVVIGVIVMIQMGSNLSTDVQIYKEKLYREQNNPIIGFYTQFSEKYGNQLSSLNKVKVLRDVRVYFPDRANFKVSEYYNTLTLSEVRKKNPDLLFIWKQRIKDYSATKSTAKAINPQEYEPIQQFFAEAKSNNIPGYQLLMENQEVKVFAENVFAQEYLLDPIIQ